MGFLEKMKNLFTEEEEIIEPVKKEVMQVEIKAPALKKEPLLERVEQHREEPVMPKEEIKPSPVFFDDKDFATLEQPKPKPKPKRKEVVVEREPVRPIYNMKQDRREKHNFQPSPIISPVYGILDKNYKKEDIVNKTDDFVPTYYKTAKEMTVDEVRKKAFGTLEDDIDLNLEVDTLSMMPEEPAHAFEEESLENDIFEEMNVATLDDTTIDNGEEDITLGNTSDEDINDINIVEESLGKDVDSDDALDESDLFNLIDSMYEKRDEK